MRKKLLSIFLLIFCLHLTGQTTQERQKIKAANNNSELLKIAENSKSRYSKKDLQAIAKKNNWEYTIVKDGSYSELVGVSEDNKPIYFQTYNEGAGITSRANRLYTGGSLGLDVNGENMISGIWDGGQALSTHELFSGRITIMDGASSSNFHATHVAGTIIGTDQVQAGAARGMAYRAEGHSYDWSNDLSEVATAANNGLLLSNHSYGINPAFVSINQWGKYDTDSRGFDDIMFNAPYYQFVCAAGNTRDDGLNTGKNGYDLLTGHAVSKNGITVAAVEEVINYTGASSVIMSGFSSWGATDDGRIKPDISAKGVDTYSAFDNSNTSYNSISGTSMASPSVNGTLLLLQQYYNQLNSAYMKSASLRGLMIHTADEAGTSPGPDYRFGWGLINAEAAANVITDKEVFSIIDENTLQQNDTYSINYGALGSEPLIVTLSWTDPAGTIPSNATDDSTPILVNDLDVRIFKDGTEIFPWKLDVLNPSFPATSGDNIVDNVEKIQIDNPSGNYQIVVSHKGNLQNGAQDYSLIMSGISTNDFWFDTQTQGDWETCNSDDTIINNFNFFRSPTFNEDATLSVVGAPSGLGALFSPAIVTNENTFSLELSGISTLTAGTYNFIVRGQSTSASYDFPVTLNVYDNLSATVNLVLPSDNTSSIESPVLFNWQAITNANSYQIQIATDTNFTSIIEDATISENEYTAQNIGQGNEYFWRVRPINPCGDGSFSTTYSFTSACSNMPSDIQLLSATESTLTVGWTEVGTSTSWEVEIIASGNPPTGTGIVTTNNPYVFTGLNSNTAYDVYVRAICTNGNSGWIGISSFSTTCAATTAPLLETFSSFSTPSCWIESGSENWNYNTNADYAAGSAGDHTPGGGTNYAWIDGSTPNGPSQISTLTTVPVDISNLTTPTLEFSVFSYNSSGDFYNTLTVEVNDGTQWIELLNLQQATNNNTWQTFIYDLSVYNLPNIIQVRYTIAENSPNEPYDNDILIDDISIDELPACPNTPMDMQLLSATSSTLTIGWTETGASTSWEVEIVASGNPPTGTGIVTTDNPHIFTGLSSNTPYDVYVRAICMDGNSDWLYSGPFSTTCSAAVAPFLETFSSFSTPSCWIESGSENWRYNTNADYAAALAGDHTQGGGTNYAWIDGSTPNGSSQISTLTTVPVDITNLTEPTLEFSVFSYNSTGDFYNTLTVEVNDGTQWIELLNLQQATSNNTWQTFIYDLSVYNLPNEIQVRYTIAENSTNEPYNNDILIDDISIDELPACPNTPTNLQLLSTTASSLTVGWTETGASTSWEVEIVAAGNPPTGTGIVTTDNPHIFTGLSSNTAYDVYVRAICMDGNSDWTYSGPFSTPCSAAVAPFLETFSSFSTPGCWIESGSENWRYNTNADYAAASAGDHTPGGGTNYAWIDGSAPNGPNQISTLTTVPVDITNLTVPSLEFSVFSYNSSGDFYNTLTVEVNDGTQWIELLNLQQATSNNNWQTFTYDLSVYNLPNEIQVRYTIAENSPNIPYNNDILIDDISIDELPACSNTPTNLQLLSATASTLTVDWTETGASTSWEVEIVAAGNPPTGTGIVTTDNPYIFTGLTSNTAYDVYVRAICMDGNSDWTYSGPFSTPCSSAIAPLLETFSSFSTPGCWIESGSENWRYNTNADYAAGFASDHTPGGGTNYAWIDGSAPNGPNQISTLTTVPVDITNLTVPSLEFSVFSYNSSGDFYNTLTVEVNDGTQWIELLNLQQATSNNTWQTFIYDLSVYNLPNEIQVRYTIAENSPNIPFNNDILIDDISIDELPACSNTPIDMQLLSATASTLTVDWTETGASTSWEVEIVAAGNPPTGTGVVTTNNTYMFTGLTSNTAYDVYVRAICMDGNSNYLIGGFVTSKDYCGADHFYDSGGISGNYQNNENWTETIYPDNAGDIVKAVFLSFELEGCCDYLSIYNGPDASYPLLFTGNGTNSPGTVESTDPTGALTFVFTSDSSVTRSGWDAEIFCETLGVEDEILNQNITYYPNPVQSELNISAKKRIKDIYIYDYLGKLIAVHNINDVSCTIDFLKYASSIYIMKLDFMDGTYQDNIKIIKK